MCALKVLQDNHVGTADPFRQFRRCRPRTIEDSVKVFRKIAVVFRDPCHQSLSLPSHRYPPSAASKDTDCTQRRHCEHSWHTLLKNDKCSLSLYRRPSPNETNSQREQSGSEGGQDQLCSMPALRWFGYFANSACG